MTSEIVTLEENALVAGSYEIGQVANGVARAHVFDDYASSKSANTLRRHRADLTLFVEYLCHCQFFFPVYAMSDIELEKWYRIRAVAMMSAGEYWQNMTFGLVEGFKHWMLLAGYAVGSVNNRLSTVKIYASKAQKTGHIDDDLIKTVKGYSAGDGHNLDTKREVIRIGRKKAIHVSIKTEQAELLLVQPKTPQGRRDRLIFSLLLEHGLRVSEIVLLKTSDFDRETNLLNFYRPKVKQSAIAHLLKNGTLAAMLAYLDKDAVSNELLLRGSRKNGTLTKSSMAEQSVNRRVGKLGEVIGIEGLSPHDCRHYCATHQAPKKTVKELMDFFGWTSAATAMRYVESACFVETD